MLTVVCAVLQRAGLLYLWDKRRGGGGGGEGEGRGGSPQPCHGLPYPGSTGYSILLAKNEQQAEQSSNLRRAVSAKFSCSVQSYWYNAPLTYVSKICMLQQPVTDLTANAPLRERPSRLLRTISVAWHQYEHSRGHFNICNRSLGNIPEQIHNCIEMTYKVFT